MDEISAIIVNSSAVNVEFDSSDDNNIIVSMSGRTSKEDAISLKTEVVEKKLYIETIMNDRVVKYDLSLEIKIPEKYFKRIEARTQSSDIQIYSTFSADTIIIDTSSGDVQIDAKIDVDNISIESSSADVSVGDELSAKKLNITTSSGDVEIYCNSDSIECRTSSGDVDVSSSLNRNTDINITTSSGDVDLEFENAKRINGNYKTNTGDIDNNHTTSEKGFEVNLTVKTSSGDITIE